MVAISSSSSNYLAYLLQNANSTNATNSYATTTSSSTTNKSKSASEIFNQLSEEVGGDGKTVTKSQLESYISNLESDTSNSSNKRKLGFLKQLDKNWDKISNGSDSITADDIKAGMSYLAPPSVSTSNGSNSSDDFFESLLNAVGADSSSGITEDDLLNYLEKLTEDTGTSDSSSSSKSSSDSDNSSSTDAASNTSNANGTNNAKEIKLVLSLLNNFNSFTDENTGTITASSFYSTIFEPQDTSTVTSSQLTSPIDLRV
jgi:Ca2+-binding EF-hand superfamily protein